MWTGLLGLTLFGIMFVVHSMFGQQFVCCSDLLAMCYAFTAGVPTPSSRLGVLFCDDVIVFAAFGKR